MSLLSNLRKRQSERFATATPATFATQERERGRTVAVAKSPNGTPAVALPSELEQLIEIVGRAYDTPEEEYPRIREAARRDVQAALQSFRAMAEELNHD